ncbi:MAG TPA: hypothetical protein VHD63_22840, partial [Ktedonobacteraceae bacterium]|nr:hypothetical protein [Ktedonobacteraceae bacterium]
MITEHTHSENNDWQEPGGEPLSVSETPTPQPAMDAPVQEEGQTNTDAARAEVEEQAVSEKHEIQDASAEGQAEQAEESAEAAQSPVVPTQDNQEHQEALPAAALEEVTMIIEETKVTSEDIRTPHLLEGEESTLFPLEVETPLSSTGEARPFTSFIEEFRQTEGHFVSLLHETDTSFTSFVAGSESIHEPVTLLETAPEDLAQVVDLAPAPATEQEQQTSQASAVSEAPASQPEEAAPAAPAPGLTQPRLSPERPVSPLLRPATRPRLPRHGRHRIDELIHPAELRGDLKEVAPAPAAPTASAAPVAPVSAPVEESVKAAEPPKVEEAKPEEPPAKPARRYRFDRPATTTSATPAPAKVSTRASESKEKRSFAAATAAENTASVEAAPVRAASAAASAPAEAPAAKTNAAPETP